ncbi:hypothetical protein J6590_065281 [Homalodisca vitripennis]|nr:hypothetical protein J6590_065278 [Homalodisca vitripennis]KAG8261834.1 hypothetical protein J6590_065281 [Homalodisca vitripennis]
MVLDSQTDSALKTVLRLETLAILAAVLIGPQPQRRFGDCVTADVLWERTILKARMTTARWFTRRGRTMM